MSEICQCCGQRLPSPPKRRLWSEGEDRRLADMLHDDKPWSAIAESLGRPVSSIGSRIKHLSARRAAGDTGAEAVEDGGSEPDGIDTAEVVEHVRPGVRVITHRIKG
jgi:hypothetical protein